MASPTLLALSHALIVRDEGKNHNGTVGKSQELWDKEGRYPYEPNVAAAWIFFAAFLMTFLINAFQYFWYRSWFWWPMLLAALMETIGFLARVLSINNLDSRSLYIVQTILILVAPAVMAASCYMAFGRIVLWVLPQPYHAFRHLWMPSRCITPFFVGFDVVSFLLQIAGGAILAGANTLSETNRGRTIVLIGLGVQLLVFGFFVVASIKLGVLLRTKLRSEKLPNDTNWGMLLTMINVAGVLILVRSVYRFVEYAMDVGNYLLAHEVFFYCLDSLLMLTLLAGYICVHPAQYLAHIGFRRREVKFSKNVHRGLFKGSAMGKAGKVQDEDVVKSGEEAPVGREMGSVLGYIPPQGGRV